MYNIEDDPLSWLGEFGTGLITLFLVQVLTGCWTIAVIRARILPNLKLPVCVLGVCVLSVLSSQIFDPATHMLGSTIAAVSMSFTAPLQAAAWVRIKVAKPSEETPAYAIIMRIAIPAALPSVRHPPERPVTQFLRGSAYITLGILLRSFFEPAIHMGGIPLNLLSIALVTCIATGALNYTSAILGFLGAPSPSPFRRPLLSPSMARFWSGRWNAPVSDALRVAIYDPLRSKYSCSRATASMACFFASAVAHELILVYCGVRDSRGEWFAFFMLSGVATMLESKVHRMVKNPIARYLLGVCTFYTLFHSLFVPVTIRTGFAMEGVRAIGSGPVLINYLFKKRL